MSNSDSPGINKVTRYGRDRYTAELVVTPGQLGTADAAAAANWPSNWSVPRMKGSAVMLSQRCCQTAYWIPYTWLIV